ncbi:unnamed protein product, partial [Rotaria sp. Silwood2]
FDYQDWLEELEKNTLETIAEETKIFKDKALTKNVLERNEITQEIQEIFNLQSYQDVTEKYVHSHLDQIIPLILYAWLVASEPQFPKDTQIVTLLLFVHS